MNARAGMFEFRLIQTLGVLEDLAKATCSRTITGRVSSGKLVPLAEALRVLALHDRFLVEDDDGEAVKGRWVV